MKVPLLDLTEQYASLREETERAVRAVCDSQRFILGPEVEALEREIADYCGCKHAIGMSSGTDALLVALMALGIGSGDAVITTAFSFFATAGVIARLGARPVFCDIDPLDFNLSPAAVSDFIAERCELTRTGLIDQRTGSRVKALLPVHLYGQMADMQTLLDIADRYRLAVVEDAAQAIGAELRDGSRAGSLGAIGCFSFFPTKNLGAFGDAGMCTTNDPETAQQLRKLRVHGGERRYFHSVVGGNFRLDELQAAVLRVKLRRLDAWTAARQANAEHYRAAFGRGHLAAQLAPPEVIRGGRHVFNQFVIRAQNRDALRAYLTDSGIGTEVYYPVPLHEQECFAYLGYAPEELPNAHAAAGDVLALPIYPELSTAQLDYVAERIACFYSAQPAAAGASGSLALQPSSRPTQL